MQEDKVVVYGGLQIAEKAKGKRRKDKGERGKGKGKDIFN